MISQRFTGGAGSHFMPKAKPVKKTSCQPKGLKNQVFSPNGLLGRFIQAKFAPKAAIACCQGCAVSGSSPRA